MIRKAQVKFVCIAMSIMLGFFTIIGTAIYYISYSHNLTTIEQNIDQTAKSFFMPDGMKTHSKTIIAKVAKTQNSQSNELIEIWYDEQFFNGNFANSVINHALNGVHPLGKINNVYYKLYSTEFDFSILVAVDSTENVVNFRLNISRTMFALLIAYLLLFFIVMKLSWWALKPLRTSFEKQQQFISNASHELKTPLSIISANVDVLRQENDNKWTSNIKSQTERMRDLVDDMLSLAKLDEGNIKLNLEKFNLSEEIIENTLPFDAVAFEKRKTLNMNVQPDIYYFGDRQSVKKIVNILLDNAIKHADEKGEIKVELKKDNNKIVFSVYNSGSSIPIKDADKIFERFYRGDSSRSRESGGSGLGLSIAKSICNSNKWKISAHSVPKISMLITIIF